MGGGSGGWCLSGGVASVIVCGGGGGGDGPVFKRAEFSNMFCGQRISMRCMTAHGLNGRGGGYRERGSHDWFGGVVNRGRPVGEWYCR